MDGLEVGALRRASKIALASSGTMRHTSLPVYNRTPAFRSRASARC